MTYLELVQKAISWSRVRSTEPSTLVGATGLVKEMMDQVANAWEELQLERQDWFWNTEQDATGIIAEGSDRFFLRTNTSVGSPKNNISGKIVYDPDTSAASVVAADLDDIQYYIMRCTVKYSPTTQLYPEKSLTFIKWDEWPYHTNDAKAETGPPLFYTLSPDGNMAVYPVPDADYRLYFRAPKVPQVLSADADEVIGIPEFMQKGIIWRAILYYAMAVQDTAMLEMARARYRPYKKWLERSEMETVTLGHSGLY